MTKYLKYKETKIFYVLLWSGEIYENEPWNPKDI